MSTMLLSIKPEYAKAILQGKKQFEFRKTRCKQGINRIIFYASSPQKEVVGEAEIDEILEGATKYVKPVSLKAFEPIVSAVVSLSAISTSDKYEQP